VESARETPAREYTIDELAAASEVPSRTIRFYQSEGVLPRPEMRGRVAYYGPSHVERLRLIASLQDRGLRIGAIRELVSRIDKGEVDVAEWLGLEAELQAPWANDQPRTVTEAELRELVGGERPGLVAALARVGLVERQGSVFLLKSPALLSVAMRLNAAGVDVEIARGAEQILRKQLSRAADELAKYFFEHARDGFGRSAAGQDLTAAFEALRPMGLEAVRVIFGQEVERALRQLVESGKSAALPAKAKRGKRS
jgi:DNA-binding transcriptional MerR regulator